MAISNYDNQNLDEEEQALEELFTSGEAIILSKEETEKERARLKKFSVRTENKKAVNLRLLESDVARIKAKAERIWIP